MPNETIRIDELHLRVPGLNAEEAHRLGQEVAHHLAYHALESVRAQRLGALDLRMKVATGTPRSLLAITIAENIARAIQ